MYESSVRVWEEKEHKKVLVRKAPTGSTYAYTVAEPPATTAVPPKAMPTNFPIRRSAIVAGVVYNADVSKWFGMDLQKNNEIRKNLNLSLSS